MLVNDAVIKIEFCGGCWACQTDSDCNDIHSPVCNTEHNYCEQQSCMNDTECGDGVSMSCRYGTCNCRQGFRFDGTDCVSTLEATCTQPNDCPTPFECRNDTCSCPEGMAIKSLNDPTCAQVIGMSCMYESYAHPDADCREYIGYNNYGSGYTYLTCYRGVEEHGNCSNSTEYRPTI
ncbi:hypothetical protein MAR_013335 [Mya arenaria]|uniref:EGF-like domain-containing protein n=1 Tax=Mya arenaria TaxID=6604 RepID=A0ABY7G3J1_MYAAR|nr:hypothetical protein MAR_013335 [Mya arenaria]